MWRARKRQHYRAHWALCSAYSQMPRDFRDPERPSLLIHFKNFCLALAIKSVWAAVKIKKKLFEGGFFQGGGHFLKGKEAEEGTHTHTYMSVHTQWKFLMKLLGEGAEEVEERLRERKCGQEISVAIRNVINEWGMKRWHKVILNK